MYNTKKAIGAGAIGGIVAGIVMLAPMMAMMSMMSLPSDLFPKLLGLTMGLTPDSATMAGMALHFVGSTLIGLLFGAAVSSSKLSISGFKKGIGLGIVTGTVSFVVLFLPMMMAVLPSSMMNLMIMMNPGATQEMIMTQLQSMQPTMLSGSIISHLIYGAVLGAVTSIILLAKMTCPHCGTNIQKKDFDYHRNMCKVK